ncbi:ArnT family glycosyltransferase [Patiriisocius hiemis]|uniref:Glycosyltransferase family 39 protein n=1 Tax=Patiriisocius hiemis TaxID=3075604 RepID=A0ABU2YFU5_9FLAO|nr:glycosyltransferase family 39 protein [Constantimarinum sp. W242]MDT0556751.1 glycosyltransferase family 39 protein [Constantimarinum sp. W242]
MKTLWNNKLLVLALLSITLFVVNLDALFVNIMEARNFITAREMLQDGNWIFTTLNGEPRYQKPPLPTWITAAFGFVFSLKNIIFLRLPAALMGILLVLVTYKFSLKIFRNKQLGFIGGLILATSFYVVSASRDSNWDIYTHAFMMLGIYSVFRLLTKESKKYGYALLAGLCIGASFLSKGPVSLYALFLPFLIAYGVTYKFKKLKVKRTPILLFLLLAILVSGSWYWYVYTFDAATISKITQKEAANWTGYNVRPFYYYWSFFTQSGVWTIVTFISLLYPYLKNRVSDKKAYTFTLLWTLGSLVLLSIIPEKKSRYLLPVLIPLALNAAFYIEYLINKFSELKDKRETIPVYFNFGLIAIIGLVFPIGGYFFLKDQLSNNWFWFILLAVGLSVTGFLMFRFLLKKNIKKVFYLTIVFITVILCFGMPLAKTLTVNPEFKNMKSILKLTNGKDLKAYDFAGFTPELIWNYGKPIPVLNTEEGITIPTEKSFVLLVTTDDTKRVINTFYNLGYSLEKVDYIDMNPHPKESSSHKVRLYRNVFLVKRQ